ncbi:MAG: aspartate aminotransferase family protein [Alphaproteobacteria bacterium]|nr:aspartate aminotransferase family protein [Alphaproteobacteria bacterium]
MDLDAFRRHGHAVVDLVADYLAGIEDRPVRAPVRPGEVDAALAGAAPETPDDVAAIMADFERVVMPGITHWQHPRFFAYFPANASPPSVLAEMLAAGIAAQCMLWQTSPAATEMESRVLDWLRDAIGLPEGFAGVIQDSASSATLVALVAARERALDGAGNAQGLAGHAPVTVYATAEAHSSIEKACRVAGIGSSGLRHVATDGAGRMRADDLAVKIAEDRAQGRHPAAVVATLGTTGIGAIDPLADIAAVARAEDVYLHVDAAWAGSALLLEEWRWMSAGVAAADSFVFNPHKWLGVQFDCAAHFVREPGVLTAALAIQPSYLTSRETGAVVDYRDWSIPLGRRFRALKLWFTLRAYGLAALRAMLRDHIAWTAELAGRIAAEPDFELTTPPSLALLTFRHLPAGVADLDADNRDLLERINADGFLYLTPHTHRGRAVLRWSIGGRTTTRRHVAESFERVKALARA